MSRHHRPAAVSERQHLSKAAHRDAEPTGRESHPPGRAARLLVAFIVGEIAVIALYAALAHAATIGWPGNDWDQAWYGARSWLAGGDAYAEVGPGRAHDWPWPLLYPMTSLLVVAPFAALPLAVARAAFVGLSAAILAYALTRDGWHRLWVLAYGGFWSGIAAAQWSSLLTAAFLIPGLGWLAAAKPNIGVALLAAARTRRQVAVIMLGGALVLLASLALDPGWPVRWLALIRASQHVRAPVSLGLGPIVLLGLLRWRRPEARLLVALACVPQTTLLYETLPLALIAQTRVESLGLALLSLLGQLGQTWAILHTGGGFNANTLATGQVLVIFCYLPALFLVLRRPNAGAAPAPVEAALNRWHVPEWLAGDAPLREPERHSGF